MRIRKLLPILLIAVLAATFVVPAVAQAGTIYVNTGVAGARLGMKDTTAAKKLGPVKKKERDPDYPGGVYYTFYFGKKVHGLYAIQMTSHGGKVMAFQVYSGAYKTTKKIHVGSTVSALKKAYKFTGTRSVYVLKGAHAKTYFNVSHGKVSSIWIWST